MSNKILQSTKAFSKKLQSNCEQKRKSEVVGESKRTLSV